MPSTERMWNWNAASARELQQRLKAVSSDVPPRGEGRTSQHIENWVLRNLLCTLANATSLLSYPLAVKKGERPDLDAEVPSGCVGIEVTEAIPQPYARAVAIQNREYPTAILDSSLFQYGEPAIAADQVRCLLQQAGDRLIGPGWMGESVEQEWAARMALVVLHKTEMLNEPTFRRQQSNWLAVYDNTPRPCLNLGSALVNLCERLAAIRRHPIEFDRVFIELPNDLVMVAGSSAYGLPLHRP